MLVGLHTHLLGIGPGVAVGSRWLRTGLVHDNPSPNVCSQTPDNPWLRGFLQMFGAQQAFPMVIFMVSHQNGTSSARRIKAGEDLFVWQGRAMVFLSQVFFFGFSYNFVKGSHLE